MLNELGRPRAPTIKQKIGTGLACEGVYALDIERLRKENPLSDLIKYNTPLAVKKGRNLQHEFKIGYKLTHPNLVKSHRLFIQNESGRCKLIMDRVEGDLLISFYKDLVKKTFSRDPLKDETIKKFFLCLKDCCLYLFDQGIYWKDVNCKNMMIDKKSELKIFDFGSWREEKNPLNCARHLLNEAQKAIRTILICSSIRDQEEIINRIATPKYLAKQLEPTEEIKKYLASYFDSIIEAFEKTASN